MGSFICEGVLDVYSFIIVYYILWGFKLVYEEDIFAVLGVDEAWGCFVGVVFRVVERLEAYSAVFVVI